jgi:translation initiation factor 3 subunit L
MSAGDLSEFESSFTFACPKFLSPVPPSFDVPIGTELGNYHKEPLRMQLNVFMDEVKQQLLLPTIRYGGRYLLKKATSLYKGSLS